VVETDVVTLIEALMNELVNLDGDVKAQRRIQEKHVPPDAIRAKGAKIEILGMLARFTKTR
jgi:hypothetical protein